MADVLAELRGRVSEAAVRAELAAAEARAADLRRLLALVAAPGAAVKPAAAGVDPDAVAAARRAFAGHSSPAAKAARAAAVLRLLAGGPLPGSELARLAGTTVDKVRKVLDANGWFDRPRPGCQGGVALTAAGRKALAGLDAGGTADVA